VRTSAGSAPYKGTTSPIPIEPLLLLSLLLLLLLLLLGSYRFLGTLAIPAHNSTVNEPYNNTGLLYVFCCACNCDNFGMHAGKKFNTQNEECMNVGISIILLLYLPINVQ
jgi:hypothetical protein